MRPRAGPRTVAAAGRAGGCRPDGAGLTPTGPRVFFAVEPPAEVRAHLDAALTPLRGAAGEPRWIPPERWHLTLLFLGRIAGDRVPSLAQVAAPAVAAAPPTTLRLAGAGRFGSPRRPQVFWAGLDGDVGAVSGLAERLADAARTLGLPVEERPFRAHLTVGRWHPRRPSDAALPQRLVGYRGPEWPVTEVRLLESHLGPNPLYETLGTWEIGR